jgi:hypothetical protein
VRAPEAAGALLQQAVHSGYGGGDLPALVARVFQVRWTGSEMDGSWIYHSDLESSHFQCKPTISNGSESTGRPFKRPVLAIRNRSPLQGKKASKAAFGCDSLLKYSRQIRQGLQDTLCFLLPEVTVFCFWRRGDIWYKVRRPTMTHFRAAISPAHVGPRGRIAEDCPPMRSRLCFSLKSSHFLDKQQQVVSKTCHREGIKGSVAPQSRNKPAASSVLQRSFGKEGARARRGPGE